MSLNKLAAPWDEEYQGEYEAYDNEQDARYWGSKGAGAILLAKDTGRFLVALRSEYVNEPHTWGTIGGKVDEGENEEIAALREIREETSYSGPIDLIPAYVYIDEPVFEYHNFIGIVPNEFPDPPTNWETEKFQWMNLEEVLELPNKHPGLSMLLNESKKEIEDILLKNEMEEKEREREEKLIDFHLANVIKILGQLHPQYLYHVTHLMNIPGISERGLVPREFATSIDFYGKYSEGKVFLSDFDGISDWFNWRERKTQELTDNPEEGWIPVVLRIDASGLDFPLLVDEEGSTKHTLGTLAYYVEEIIPPESISIWDGSEWESIQALSEDDIETMNQHALEMADVDMEDGEELYYLDYNTFNPQAKIAQKPEIESEPLPEKVRENLTDDLRRAPWKGHENPYAGHCYVASEALYHLMGGQDSGWKPKFIPHEGSPHWFLQHAETGEILDPTAEQFETPVPYEEAVGKGFLTKEPSKRAQELINRVYRKGQQKELPFKEFTPVKKPDLIPPLDTILFHGTIIDNLSSIKELGAYPSVGDFVEEAYGSPEEESELEELIFSANFADISNSITAMVKHISNKLGKNFHEVSIEDVRDHGLLLAFHWALSQEDYEELDWEHRPSEDRAYYTEYPIQVEPGDYFSRYTMVPDDYLHGRSLMQFLSDFELLEDYSWEFLFRNSKIAHKDFKKWAQQLDYPEIETERGKTIPKPEGFVYHVSPYAKEILEQGFIIDPTKTTLGAFGPLNSISTTNYENAVEYKNAIQFLVGMMNGDLGMQDLYVLYREADAGDNLNNAIEWYMKDKFIEMWQAKVRYESPFSRGDRGEDPMGFDWDQFWKGIFPGETGPKTFDRYGIREFLDNFRGKVWLHNLIQKNIDFDGTPLSEEELAQRNYEILKAASNVPGPLPLVVGDPTHLRDKQMEDVGIVEVAVAPTEYTEHGPLSREDPKGKFTWTPSEQEWKFFDVTDLWPVRLLD